jgi:NarL family two-component system response regulator LiaR
MEQALVIDDWTLVREGVVAVLLTTGLTTGVAVGTATEALIGLADADVKVVVIGSCADSTTVEVVRRIATARPDVRIVALVGAVNQRSLVEMCSAGAHGVVLRTAGTDDLRDALAQVGRGGRYLSPSLLSTLFSDPAAAVDRRDGAFGLTTREQAVLAELAAGHSNQQIASTLHIGVETVKTHLGNIYAKLAVRGRDEAISVALQDGLLAPV